MDIEVLEAPLRERTLWWLLHESGTKVSTALSLNVEDLVQLDRAFSALERIHEPFGHTGEIGQLVLV